MSKRNLQRIDYKQLNSDGNIVPVDRPPVDLSLQESSLEMENTDTIDLTVMCQEVLDIIDENPVYELDIEELDTITSKLELMRTSIRKKHLVVSSKENISDDLHISFNNAIASIKDFIKTTKDSKVKSKLHKEKCKSDEAAQKERATSFLLDCTNRSIEEMEVAFGHVPEEADSYDLFNWRNELPSNKTKFDKITDNYKECLQSPIVTAETMLGVKDIGERYVRLDSLKQTFIKELNSEITKRELDKDRKFNKSQLNIKIDKFSGYDDSTDFYTFRTNFEKMHLTSTPKRLLPDLLRNNYLADPALTVAKSLDTIDEIWERLKEAYGNTRIMLSKKLQRITHLELNQKDPEKLVAGISKLINMLQEVTKLANTHKIEEYLYYGDSLARIYQILGDRRTTRFLSTICENDFTPMETWERLITFLNKERRIQQQKMIATNFKMDATKKEDIQRSSRSKRPGQSYLSTPESSDPVCSICDAPDGNSDHISTSGPSGTKILQYYTCKAFVNKTPAARLNMLKEKGYCFQCLYPGAMASSGKHAEGRCQRDFACPHPSHQKYPVKKHVLVCEEHKTMDSNRQLLQKFIQRFIRSPLLPDFSKNINLSVNTEAYKVDNQKCTDSGIYLLQEIYVNANKLLIFYDNGCSDFVVSQNAINLLGSNATQVSTNPIILGGVGNTKTESSLGTYKVTLPLHNGNEVTLSGVCLQQITSNFPVYPLDTVEKDIQRCYSSSGGLNKLPKLPASIGGEVHMMIGIKYLRYHPKMIFQLPLGLAIYESKFDNSSGGRGVVGGPHHVFTDIHQHHNNAVSTFFSNEYKILKESQSNVPLLGYNHNSLINSPSYADDDTSRLESKIHLSTSMRVFEEVEATGSEITYRCPQCRNCKTCKHESTNGIISIKEEVEQSIINSSVSIDLTTNIATASLPFIADPVTRLTNNKDKAMKVYTQQTRKLNNPSNHKDKQDIIDSEEKLQQLGYVDYVRNLPTETKSMLQSNKMQHFIPWRAVWKGNSISTPCRIVFDASQATSSGFSLNDLLAKGRNNLNKLQEMIIRWSIHRVAIHTDVKKMYNTIKLDEKDWCYQRYLWQDELDATKSPEEKVVKTLIYGVKSSGNQAEYALRKIANISKDEFPDVNEIIQHDVYVDDCVTGEADHETAHRRADQLEVVLNRGGFKVKGVAFSGEDPPDTLSDDGETIHVAGLKWFVKSDMMSLNIGELNFGKKSRGKKPSHTMNVIPAKLTRRHCASKVAEVFDLTGKVSPLIASMKIDLQELVQHHLDWDDVIPDNLRPLWESNFDMIKEIGNLRFRRAIIPEDAVSLVVNTIDFGDASNCMVCVVVYARFLRRNGKYSCQMTLSRTRVVPKDLSQPRSELYAALICSHTGEIVRRSLGKWHKTSIKLTDSQIVLHWIDNEEKPLKQWVRNRVVEIKRFSPKHQWFYINTTNMIADIGTRKGATLNDVNNESTWINGFDWMQSDVSKFPIKNAQELKLNEYEISEVHRESHFQVHHVEPKLSDDYQERYKFSRYVIDPNYRSFNCVVRILAYVVRFCNKLKMRTKSDNSTTYDLTEVEIHSAEMYFYKKATAEIIQFLHPRKYESFTTLKDDVLIYKGRILPDRKVTIVGRFTDAMLDLSSTTFCVPVVDKNSPVAFSMVSDIHWNDRIVKHAGIETTLRQTLKKVFVIEGRSLVKLIKKSCQRCKVLNKRTLAAVMGPVPESSLTVAPAFYHTQLDLSGPYKAFSPLHKRTTVKIWLVVYCCCSTSAVMINVMDDYTTASFVQSFIRFSSRYGFPKKVFIDEGSQLVKGVKDMKLCYSDIKSKLHKERNVEFQTCPVGAHNMNGKVERKIKEINASLERSIQNERLSILQWETVTAVIANSLNDLPLAVGNVIDVENMDLLTPNRLILGRNNDRSPSGQLVVSDNQTKTMKANSRIYEVWFESWLMNHVPKLMHQSKWFKHERNLQVGDVVLFTKIDSVISKTYTYGMVKSVEIGDDGKVRRVTLKYQNQNEKVHRETTRSVRNLVLINSIDDSDIMFEISEMAKRVDDSINC